MSDQTDSGAPGDDQSTNNQQDGAHQDDTQLGDAGTRALAEERKARKAAEKAARDTTAELERLRASSMNDQEKAIADAKKAGRDEVLSIANRRIASAAVISEAAGKLINPALAPKLVDLSSIPVDDDGEPDAKAVRAAIADVVKDYPELAAASRGMGDAGQGVRSRAGAAGDMNTALRRAAGRM